MPGADSALPNGLHFDPVTARLSGIPSPSTSGTFTLVVQVRQIDGDAEVAKMETFKVTITRPEHPLLHAVNSYDVDGNGKTEALDALRVLNFLRLKTSDDVNLLANLSQYFYDANDDNIVAVIDALVVLNRLWYISRGASGESASIVPALVDLDSKTKARDVAIQDIVADPQVFLGSSTDRGVQLLPIGAGISTRSHAT